MTLKMFEFIDEVIEELNSREIELEEIAIDIKEVFRDIIGEDREGFSDVKARVKSSESLKEKIKEIKSRNKKNTKRNKIPNTITRTSWN